MEEKWVSVVIPTYGREINLVRRSIDSVLNQDYPWVECILVDDNMLNNPFSEEIKTYCLEHGVHYFKTFGKQGACAARNFGFANSCGQYVGFLDDDDEWMKEKVSVSVPLFEPGVGMVGTRGYQIDIKRKKKEPYMCSLWKKEPTFQELLCCDHIGTTTLAIVEREAFIKSGGFRIDLPARQDYDCWLRISRNYRIVFSEQFLFKYYQHDGDQITKSPQKALEGLQKIYKEFQPEFKKDKHAYTYIWALMMRRYEEMGSHIKGLGCLIRILRVNPRYMGRYIMRKTKNEKLRSFLRRYQKNLAEDGAI